MCKLTHLHVHSEASLLDGLGTVENLVSRVKSIGHDSLALTDHGTLSNAINFIVECKSQNIKHLLGLEGYIVFNNEIGHITLLADGNKGWQNLVALNNLAHRSDYKQPAFTVDQLVKHSDSLVCLTGCVSSPFHQLNRKESYDLGLWLKNHFGNRLFAEVMLINDDRYFVERSKFLSDKLKIKPVITNDVHFSSVDGAKTHPILTKLKGGFSYDSGDLWAKSYNELKSKESLLGDCFSLDDLCLNAYTIGQKLDEINLKRDYVLPKVPKEKRLGDLVNSCHTGLSLDYQTRLENELDIIKKTGYSDYFLIIYDIVSEAKRLGAKIGPGRGSGAGSLVLYLLGITDVDPVQYGLEFSRFLNLERESLPDVDIDIDSVNRDKVIDYAVEKYNSLPVATYSRYSHKSLIRDLGRILKIDKNTVDNIADKGPNSKEFINLTSENELLKTSYNLMNGQIRHKGKHAGGIVIVDNIVPIERQSDGTHSVAWTEGKQNELSCAGIVKFDLLGLSVLSALNELEKSLDRYPYDPIENDQVFDIFKKGDLVGIFQFSGSDGVKKLTMDLQPNSINDLAAINALYRPGPLDSGTTEKYPLWKKTPRKTPEVIKDILEPTYGAIVFQEQFMKIYARVVGGTMSDADLARLILVKSKPDDKTWKKKFDKLKEDFLQKAKEKMGDDWSRKIWSEIETHTRYSFNKSHSLSYSMIAWQCAYWKHYYRGNFYAAMLNTNPSHYNVFFIDSVMSGISVVPPDINTSTDRFVYKDNKIYMPLQSVKFLGETSAKKIVELRPAKGFDNLSELMKIVPKSVLRSNARNGLYQLGGLNSLINPDHPEEIKVLDLKSYSPVKNCDVEFLGIRLPQKHTLDKIKSFEELGFTCGFINKTEVRDKGKGKYKVVWVDPSGVFWTKDKDLKFDHNSPIAFKQNDYGMLSDLRYL